MLPVLVLVLVLVMVMVSKLDGITDSAAQKHLVLDTNGDGDVAAGISDLSVVLRCCWCRIFTADSWKSVGAVVFFFFLGFT